MQKSSRASSPSQSQGATAKNVVKGTLVLLEKALDGIPIPGVKGAVGGILEIVKILEVRSFG